MSKMIQIRNVPDALHKRICARADEAGLTLSDYLHGVLEREAQYVTIPELRKRLADLEPVRTTESAVETLRAVRDEREKELDARSGRVRRR